MAEILSLLIGAPCLAYLPHVGTCELEAIVFQWGISGAHAVTVPRGGYNQPPPLCPVVRC